MIISRFVNTLYQKYFIKKYRFKLTYMLMDIKYNRYSVLILVY